MNMLLLLISISAPISQDTIGFGFTINTVQRAQRGDSTALPADHRLATRGHLTVVMRDTVGGQAVQVIIDSSTTSSAGDGTTTAITIPDGTRYTLLLSDGQPITPTPVHEPSLGTLQALPLVQALFPRLLRDATVDDRWADTTQITTAVTGMPSTGTRVTHWHVVDRQGDLVMIEAVTTAATTTTLDSDNNLRLEQHGTVRAAVRPPGPVEASRVVETADIRVHLGGVTVQVQQQTTIALTRDRPRLPIPRRRVPT